MKKSYPKIAIFYEAINQWGGAERVLLDILKIYPNSDILTLIHKPVSWLPKNTKIITPFFNLKKYDLIISTGAHIPHYINADIYYFHNLNRHLYKSKLFFPFQVLDNLFIKKNKLNLCNSKTVKQRLKNTYNINATIINPGINTKIFIPTPKPKANYFLCVYRLVPYKNIDQAIIACQELKQKLIIVGAGRQEKYLRKISDPKYIKFTGKINEKQLIKYYQNCKALICPQIEDFGLTPIEAQSCGRPVIGLNKGGITETVINHKTGILYKKENTTCLKKTLTEFSKLQFSSKDCRQNALIFSSTNFMLNFKKQIEQYLKNK